MKPQLEVSNLRAGYGAINVLWDVSLSAARGKTTAILGPNGAGKTTLLKTIMGLVSASAGEVRLGGAAITNARTWNLVSRGLVMIPEGRMIFPDMSVHDNLLMGAFPKHARPKSRATLEAVTAMFPRLAERRNQAAGTLSGGEAQMLAMARGLMEQPEVLLIDEPSLGLAPVIVDEIFATLATLRERGMTIILVEQNTHHTLSVADHVYVMRAGKVILSQAGNAIDLDHLHDLYFSREAGSGDSDADTNGASAQAIHTKEHP